VRSNFLPPSAYRLRFYRAQSLSCPEIAVLCGVAHGAGRCEREQGLFPDSNFDFEEEETGMGTVPEEGTAKKRKIETGEGGGGGGGGGRRPAAEYPPMKRARTAGSGRSLPLCSLRGGIPVCCHWHTETRRTSSAPASVRASVPDERASVPDEPANTAPPAAGAPTATPLQRLPSHAQQIYIRSSMRVPSHPQQIHSACECFICASIQLSEL
jgi:hypothetical protein